MKQNESIFLSDTAEIYATQSYKCEVNLEQKFFTKFQLKKPKSS